MYESKEERMMRHKQEATETNNQFVVKDVDHPEKRDYRHNNMKQEFRYGAINYHKHMGWLDG